MRSAKILLAYALACLATATVVALVRFEVEPGMVVVGYALIVFALLLATWRTRHEIFLYQALIVLGFVAFRIAMYNFYLLHEQYSTSLRGALWAIGILAACVPLTFLVRGQTAQLAARWPWAAFLLRRPEQPMFFAPALLLGILLFLQLSGGMITLAWGAEGIVIFILALWAKERSFRLTGLGFLLLSVGKIGCWDAWQFGDSRRIFALLGVGAILLAVSFLYGKNREALREYL